ncbi:MAG: hypothetical protein ACR2G5_08945 [Pyrinomonadaceae bacterium]
MTLEQKYDQWERIARPVYEDAIRATQASRKQTKKLKFYLDALTKYEAAKYEAAKWSEERPEDSETKEGLLKAGLILNRAREELRH